VGLIKGRGQRQRTSALARSSRRQKTLLAVAIALGIAHAGCGRSPYELAPARGTVTIDGEPLCGGRVMFAPIARGESRDAGKPAFGTLQPDGSYVLTTYREHDGAVVGEHWVTIFGPKAEPETQGRSAPRAPKFHRFVVRQKQSIVAGRENQVDLQLSSRDIARFASQD